MKQNRLYKRFFLALEWAERNDWKVVAVAVFFYIITCIADYFML